MLHKALENLAGIKQSFPKAQTSVVLGANCKTITPQIHAQCTEYAIDILINEQWKQGISSSIQIALQHSISRGCSGLLITLADQPYINVNELIHLLELGIDEGIAAARYNNSIGVPVYFSQHYFPQLNALQGDLGASKLLKGIDQVATISFENLTDIDTKTE